MSSTITIAERARGALLGLAAGDAPGTTLEFTGLDPFAPRVTTIVGAGPFNQPSGGW
jgi:ADP-ribosyl-[dinitrogen reductase] hydrolase